MKLFRKIRQNLLMENPPAGRAGKTGRYVKYAIGEIVLVVVIGILTAENLALTLKGRFSRFELLNIILV